VCEPSVFSFDSFLYVSEILFAEKAEKGDSGYGRLCDIGHLQEGEKECGRLCGADIGHLLGSCLDSSDGPD
jgi:hypothetical protein